MSIKIGNHFYIVTFPDRPLYKIETIILDANVVGHIYDWALGKRTAIGKSQIEPLLELLRSARYVEYISGVIESSWGLPRGTEMGPSNYDQIRLNDVRLKVRAIDTVIHAEKKAFSSWLDEKRTTSIDFTPFVESRAHGLTQDKALFQEVSQIIMKDWVSFLSLMKYMKRLWDCDDLDVMIQEFRNWRDELYSWRAPIGALSTYLAKIAFFGGTIQSRFFVQEDKTWREAKIYDRNLLFKHDDWIVRGLVQLARNFAFDAHLFQERLMWESGYVPWGYNAISPIRCTSSVTGIVTADQGVNAINSMIESINPIGSPQAGYRMTPPKDSKLIQYLSESQITELLSFSRRSSKEVLDSTELVPIAQRLMDELSLAK